MTRKAKIDAQHCAESKEVFAKGLVFPFSEYEKRSFLPLIADKTVVRG